MGWQGLPDGALWSCVSELRVGQRIRVGGRVVLLDIYYIYLAFNSAGNLFTNICININVAAVSEYMQVYVCAPYAQVFNSQTPSGRCQQQLVAGSSPVKWQSN